MMFLRGNMDFYKFAQSLDPKLNVAELFYNRTGSKSIVISEDTAILIPLLTTTFTLGGSYGGSIMVEDQQIRRAAREENDLSGLIYARISILATKTSGAHGKLQDSDSKISEWQPIVGGKYTKNIPGQTLINDFHISSPVSKLRVSGNNPYLPYLSTMYHFTPGETDSITDGWFLILYKLKSNISYRIQYGGAGIGGYVTDCVCDLHVTESPKSKLRDISQDAGISIAKDRGKIGIPDRSELIGPLERPW
jgi:hypothetical protein